MPCTQCKMSNSILACSRYSHRIIGPQMALQRQKEKYHHKGEHNPNTDTGNETLNNLTYAKRERRCKMTTSQGPQAAPDQQVKRRSRGPCPPDATTQSSDIVNTVKRHFLKYMEDAGFLITASNNAQGRVHVHITSERATVIVKAGAIANSKPGQTSHPRSLRRA